MTAWPGPGPRMAAMEVTAAGAVPLEEVVGGEADDAGLAARGEAASVFGALAALLLRSGATRRPRTPGLRRAGAGANVQARLRWAHCVQGCLLLHLTFR